MSTGNEKQDLSRKVESFHMFPIADCGFLTQISRMFMYFQDI